jgi:hypothetical protein
MSRPRLYTRIKAVGDRAGVRHAHDDKGEEERTRATAINRPLFRLRVFLYLGLSNISKSAHMAVCRCGPGNGIVRSSR